MATQAARACGRASSRPIRFSSRARTHPEPEAMLGSRQGRRTLMRKALLATIGVVSIVPAWAGEPRARDIGVPFDFGTPGRWNAISDVPGVEVGHVTLIEGDSVRT